MLGKILHELKHHAPYTFLGAVIGVFFMLAMQHMPYELALNVFNVMHPAHVFLSALATASMYSLHQHAPGKPCNLWILLAIGYIGSVGIATLSDSMVPYVAELLLGMEHAHTHIGFIELWWLVNPLAIAGILIAARFPSVKLPHSLHTFVSTAASLFHIMMAIRHPEAWWVYLSIALFLFIAVWVPCCLSDIVFPLLFVKKKA